MADQLVIRTERDRITERSQLKVTVDCRDLATQAAATPTTLEYKLFNLSTGENIKDWTSLTAAANQTFSIVSADNAIRSELNPTERMQLIVVADRALDTAVYGDKLYEIMNLEGYRQGLD